MLEFMNQFQLAAHEQTQGHKNTVKARNSAQQSGPTHVGGQPAGTGYLVCNVCQKSVHVDVWVSHTTRHTSYQRKVEVEEALHESEKDKNGVTVSYKDGVDFGIIDSAELKRTAELSVMAAQKTGIRLRDIKLSSAARGGEQGSK